MAREDILFRQSVAILVDGNNIERSIHNLTGNTNSMVNFDTLVPRLLNGRALNRFIYFREGRSISGKLAERLHEHYYGIVVPCHKSADIPLSIYATQIADKVDTVIILSGDSDYVELVRHMRSRGVRVEIASVGETTADILRKESDYWHPIVSADCFELKSTGSTNQSSRSSSKSTSDKRTPAKPSSKSQKKSTSKSTTKSKAKPAKTASKPSRSGKSTKTATKKSSRSTDQKSTSRKSTSRKSTTRKPRSKASSSKS